MGTESSSISDSSAPPYWTHGGPEKEVLPCNAGSTVMTNYGWTGAGVQNRSYHSIHRNKKMNIYWQDLLLDCRVQCKRGRWRSLQEAGRGAWFLDEGGQEARPLPLPTLPIACVMALPSWEGDGHHRALPQSTCPTLVPAGDDRWH